MNNPVLPIGVFVAVVGTHGSTVNVSVTAVDLFPFNTPTTFAVYVVQPVKPVNV